MMKKLFYLLPLFICFTSISQKEKVFTVTSEKTELIQNKLDGKFSFILPKSTTTEEVERNSSFYKLYFSVSFNESTKEAIVKMEKNDEKSRHIISRFLTSFGIEAIQTDGSLYSLEEFYTTFLK